MGGVKILNSRKKIYKIFLLIKLYLWKGVTLKLRQQDFWPLPPSLRSSAEIDQTFSNPKVKKNRKPDRKLEPGPPGNFLFANEPVSQEICLQGTVRQENFYTYFLGAPTQIFLIPFYPLNGPIRFTKPRIVGAVFEVKNLCFTSDTCAT